MNEPGANKSGLKWYELLLVYACCLIFVIMVLTADYTMTGATVFEILTIMFGG